MVREAVAGNYISLLFAHMLSNSGGAERSSAEGTRKWIRSALGSQPSIGNAGRDTLVGQYGAYK